jgi:glutamine amidotransferase
VKVAVVDHGMGNLRSVAKAIEAAGADVSITSQRAEIENCDALCVPGQGIFGRCVANIRHHSLEDALRKWIEEQRPYLGICLGMQVLFDLSDEGGPEKGLGILRGRVTRLPDTVRVPHIGWNTVNSEYFYFDHSYAVHPQDESVVTGWCEHGDRFAARIEAGSLWAVQFHPEKSGRAGITLLGKWLASA